MINLTCFWKGKGKLLFAAAHRIIIIQVSSIIRVASPNLSGFDTGYVSSTIRSQALVAQIISPLT